MKRMAPQDVHADWKAGRILVLDVRTPSAFAQATEHIPGDLRRDPDQLAEWSRQLPRDRPIVAYCT